MATGESANTFEAFKNAISKNPHVGETITKRLTSAQVPDHFSYGSRDEAKGYVYEAQEQWIRRPDAFQYLITTQTDLERAIVTV